MPHLASRRLALGWLSGLLCAASIAAAQGPAPTALTRIDDSTLLHSVKPLALDTFDARRQDERTQQMLQEYFDSVLDWGRLQEKQYRAVPGHPDWGYYGDGDHRENAVRAVCYAVCVNAFLAEIEPPLKPPAEAERERYRRQAVAALRYLVQSHRVNGGTCLNGKPWGDQWQSAAWTRSLGLGAWLLWDKLDRELQLRVARVIEYEADRFIGKRPKSSLKNDTGAEENAWNAGLVALGCCMMPRHPRAAAWDRAAKTYMYNTFSTVADKSDASRGDDGQPVNEWVTTVNAHEDLTVENHGLVHVGYLKGTHAMMLEDAAPYVMVGRDVPKACLHHVDGVLEVLLKCIAWEGAPIYFGGNDWKLVHTQCSDLISFALSANLLGDAKAARVSATAFEWLRRIQKEHGGRYTVREDIEHNGLVATRMMSCYLVAARLGAGAEPVSQQELDEHITGVTHLKHGEAIVHRTPTKFASFAWGSKRMALAMPKDGNWVVWPHYASYLGLIDGRDASTRAKAKMVGLDYEIEPARFTVTGTLERLGGKLTQDFAFASLEKDVVVYVERLRPQDGFQPRSRETGIVGHEYPLGENTRTLRGRFGRKEVVGTGNPAIVDQLQTDWLNVGGRVGYVVCRGEGRENVMRYHDLTKGVGRVPKLQEWFSLVGDTEGTSLPAAGDWACVVTFLNQSAEETAASLERVRFKVDGDTATCRIGDDVVRVDFAQNKTRIEESAL